MDTFERLPIKAKKAVFDKLLDIADVSKLDEKERARYDEALKIYRDYFGSINSAKRQGKAEGLEEGKAKGLAEGEAKGKAKGKAEGLIIAARGMKELGLSLQDIVKATGLSPDEIDKL